MALHEYLFICFWKPVSWCPGKIFFFVKVHVDLHSPRLIVEAPSLPHVCVKKSLLWSLLGFSTVPLSSLSLLFFRPTTRSSKLGCHFIGGPAMNKQSGWRMKLGWTRLQLKMFRCAFDGLSINSLEKPWHSTSCAKNCHLPTTSFISKTIYSNPQSPSQASMKASGRTMKPYQWFLSIFVL